MTEHRAPTRTNNPAAFRAIIWLFAAVVLAFSAVTIANAILPGKSIKDYELWHATGQHVLHGEPIYPAKNYHKFPFMYPPPAAIFLAPMSALGKLGLVVALVAANACAWFASILLSVRLVAGNWQRQHMLLYVIPSAIVAVYVWSNFHLGQPSVVLLALMLGAFVALQGKRHILAGALIALAAGIKAFPFIAIVYLVYRRYWLATASLVVTLAFLLLVLPTPFRSFQQARADLQEWTEGMLLKYNEKGVAQRPGRSNSWKNQSIFGLANRTLRHIDADEQVAAHTPVYRNVANVSFKTVNGIILASGLILGLVYLAVIPLRSQRNTETNAIEFALLLLLMLLFTPLAFGYLFAWLLFPFTVLVSRLLMNRNRSLLVCGMVAVLLLVLSIPWQRTAQTYGNNFFATLVLFAGLAVELWRTKRRPMEPGLIAKQGAPCREKPAERK